MQSVRRKSKQLKTSPLRRKERDDLLLDAAFTKHSRYENSTLRFLLDSSLTSEFLNQDREEPSLGTHEGNCILASMKSLCFELSNEDIPSGGSIYAFFIGESGKLCLICGKHKTSLQRGIECVRSHLNHRPFVCGGETTGCEACIKHQRLVLRRRSFVSGSHSIKSCLTCHLGPLVSSVTAYLTNTSKIRRRSKSVVNG
jgi:hypothetical protein